MIDLKFKNCNKTRMFCALAVILTNIGGVAIASKNFIQDRRITMEQAKEMAKALEGSKFQITLNEEVLKQLNFYLGTPDGRNFMKDSLERMEKNRAIVEAKLQEYNLPKELMAVPLMESGYQNLLPSKRPQWSAGIWQFIPPTAKVFGLKIDKEVDERLDLAKSTDAAARFLNSLYGQFHDWRLATLGYNSGGKEVERVIASASSRDPWVLLKSGLRGDRYYLPKIIAAILIMKNPESLN